MSEFRVATSRPSEATLEETSLHAGPEARPAQHPRASAGGIVHLIKHCSYGNGSVHVAVDLACLQARNGHAVAFVSAGGTFVPLLERNGVRHVTLPHEGGDPLDLLRATVRVTRLAREMNARVLHAHMMTSALIGYVASRLTGTPLVTTVHNSFDRHSAIMRLGDRVVAVSAAEKAHLLERGYPSAKLEVVANAPARSPRDGFLSDSTTPLIATPCISTVCGLHPRKGVFDLIAACAKVFAEVPEWRLYIAGEGPDREALERQTAELGMEDRIVFLGFVRDPRALLEKSDIFVLASYTEPFGLSLAEARAAGCALVATNVGGMPEILDYGQAGRLVPPGEPNELAQALRELTTDPALRQSYRKRALAGSEHFNTARLVADYDRVYREAWNAAQPAAQPAAKAGTLT